MNLHFTPQPRRNPADGGAPSRLLYGRRRNGLLEPSWACRLDCAKLWLRVQADAFRFAPLAFIQALFWRARGLRVRSRNRIAALAGRSPCAYRYWIARREPSLNVEPKDPATATAFVPVIVCGGGSTGLEATFASIPCGTRTVVIGSQGVAGATSIQAPADLVRFIGDSKLWLCPIACGDRLAPGALAAYSRAIAEAPGAELIYADDDLCDSAGNRRDPHFKPDWNPELFEWHDFLTGACVVAVTRDVLTELPNEGWSEVIVRRVIERGVWPVHLRHIVHHRLRRPEPILPPAEAPELESSPRVTIIVPTRDRAGLLRKCVEGIEQTRYPALDVIVVDNESRELETQTLLDDLRLRGVNVISAAGPFNFSALNNLAVAHARGGLLCFLNNDVEMTSPDWLTILVHQAIRPDIGAVGARLLYADGTVQHAGVFTGIGGGAGHAHRHQRHDERGYFERSRLPQRVSAVTAACLVVAKDKFLAVGGFDEAHFPVAFNDVDLCLKLNTRGWQSLYEPRATLIHHESRSRGSDRAKSNRLRFAAELEALKGKWATDRNRDPFHHPHLSPFCEQFLISV